MIKKNISIIVFLWGVILFCFNLRVSYTVEINNVLFWASIMFILGSLLYQIFYIQNNQFIIFEIIIFFFVLHLLVQLDYFGLAGSDSYKDYDLVKTIINNNHIIIDPINSVVTGWPLLHFLSSFVSIITHIDPLLIAKFLPSFIESIIAISIYLLVHYIYKNEKAALLSCLIVGTIPKFVSFESLFVRESYALYFFIFFFYLLYTGKHKNDHRLLVLSIFLIPIIVLSHHFTAFMLIILLFFFIVISWFFLFLSKKRTDMEFNKINIFHLFIILVTSALFYWSYFTPDLMKNFFQIYFEATGVKEFISYGQQIGLSQTIVTLRGNILFYGFFFFQGTLAVFLFFAILLKKQKQIIENVTFTVFLFFCLFLGCLSLLVLGSIIFPDRFLPFGWLLGSIPLSALFFTLKGRKLKKIVLSIIICFLLFNIYNIDPNYYTVGGLFDGRASEKEYAIAETINITKPYYGYTGVGNAIYDLQRFDFRNGGMKNPITIKDFFNSSKLAIIYKDLYIDFLATEEIKSLQTYNRIKTLLSYEDFRDFNKICDIGDVFIITWSKN